MLVLAGDKNELVSSVVLKFTVGSTKTEKKGNTKRINEMHQNDKKMAKLH